MTATPVTVSPGDTVEHAARLMYTRRVKRLPVVDGPVDTTAAVSAETFRQVLELAAADEEVDALIALVLPTAATGDLAAAVRHADVRVPLAAVLLDQAESVRLLPGAAGQVPAYGYPEAAAAALARASSTRSSPGPTGHSRSTPASRRRRTSRRTRSCAGCADQPGMAGAPGSGTGTTNRSVYFS
jgi:acyl-CoA synthetase (NDP forming)